ncbi:hypothetical protein BCV72DRAFT_260548 [Rhizopus microsporus var. microsporus]|uniref:RNA polymerase II degradation factor 1 n=2 Tax=Rhizopus microsporus TaxID=58291 RepID=A0A2G4T189_RHIZD|nr:uncharacterized protein RHIMIDRAFT_290420 [Rhizopus microsporus ATCC 52813]ORE09750.1 hypothetical protein BCV72DRAFT_260548 [Rhizopus microsporus var. microsporus]PHZ14779.1 hypothetical protein RHIMIDRAFT_290420 [Rhizopus microsporus ATCC 52813]
MSSTEKNDAKKLKSKYTSQLSMLKELFTDWTEEDLLFTLQDTDGDLELAIDRISIGHANQWDEVKTKKSKKEAQAVPTTTAAATNTTTATTTTATTNVNNGTNRSIQESASHKPRSMSKQQQQRSSIGRKPLVPWQTTTMKKSTLDQWSTPVSHDPLKAPSSNKKPNSAPKTWASLLQESNPEPVTEDKTVNNNKQQEQPRSWLMNDNKEKSTTKDDLSTHLSKLKLNEERTEIKQSSVLDDLFNSVKPQTEKTSSLFNSLDYSIYGGLDQQYRSNTMNYYDNRSTTINPVITAATPIHPVITPATTINPVIPAATTINPIATTTTPPATVSGSSSLWSDKLEANNLFYDQPLPQQQQPMYSNASHFGYYMPAPAVTKYNQIYLEQQQQQQQQPPPSFLANYSYYDFYSAEKKPQQQQQQQPQQQQQSTQYFSMPMYPYNQQQQYWSQ